MLETFIMVDIIWRARGSVNVAYHAAEEGGDIIRAKLLRELLTDIDAVIKEAENLVKGVKNGES